MEPLLAVRQFVPFGLSHRVVLVVLVVVAAALIVVGRRYRGTPTERRLSQALALVFAGFLVSSWLYWPLSGQSEIMYSLPLQLCDLAAMAVVWALWSYSSTAFALAYFWGLTLSSQAFISPALTGPDFPSLQFLAFFGMHSLVVWGAIYLTWGVGLRPDWRSYRIAVLVTLGWGVVIFAFNLVAGTNYGFLNTKPVVWSLLNVLGPWPWYLLCEVVLGAAAWALITWPWVRQRAARNAHTADVSNTATPTGR
ncbi:MAG TPA: TIGR02206 family membrane protein [Pseudonocardiaceae bacterium]|nr:TIGR02206 family membrane protein [Pseudonocardiaceae bacterium]